ncbi:MAG TPA: hypothetical protein EYP22_11130 [Methanosarcinales archaeon]|nr:hypothetical protein [Methanosarcinales archaeon]
MQNGYFKRTEEFFKCGKKEYEEGFKENDTIKIQEGCEKVCATFHSLVELSNAILAEYGVPIPEDHIKRSELLQQFGLSWLYDSAK